MSLHLNHNVKEPCQTLERTTMPPRSLRFGGLSSVNVGDRSKRYLLAAPRPVNSPLSATCDSVKPFFQKNVMSEQFRGKSGRAGGSTILATPEGRCVSAIGIHRRPSAHPAAEDSPCHPKRAGTAGSRPVSKGAR
jgi:hypothetical protein